MAEEVEEVGRSHSNSAPVCSSSTKDEIRSVAHNIAEQHAQISKPGVWGVLTAISEKARKRSQGMHILLHGNEHILGRSVKEASYQFESQNVSARHCRIYKKNVVLENTEQTNRACYTVFLKDSSSNGTYLNWERLKKDSPEAQVQHGDIISLVNPPEHENAFAFVFREIRQDSSSCHQQNSITSTPGKRKPSVTGIFGEEFVGNGKRIKGLGIGGPEGPVSLDDVRRLQRSNEELRQQLEDHVLTIEKQRNEARATAVQHDTELKELGESISASFLEQIKEIRLQLATKVTELEETTALSTQRQSCIEDLNQQLAAASQSRIDAEEIIQSQKTAITELEQQLEEERSQRRGERKKAEADLKAAVERVRVEALEELKRQSETAARQHKEQLDVINKLQESDKENRALMETLRSKLEDVRESLMKAEKKARQLEVHLHEEESASAAARKKAAEREHEIQRIKIELEKEKAAREDAWAKVSTLELEMAAAIRDLGLEKQRLQGARERIVLRETQLRAFHATAEEIAVLQQKQQEQLNGMLKTLEDGEDSVLPMVDDDVETRTENLCGAVTRVREEIMAGNIETVGIEGGAAFNQAETTKKAEETDCGSDSSSVEKCNTSKRTIGKADEDWEDGDTQEEDCADTLQITQKHSRHDTEVPDTMLNQDDDQIGTERLVAIEAEATQLVESTSGGKRLDNQIYPSRSEPDRSSKHLKVAREDDEMKDCEEDIGGETMQLNDEDQTQMCRERTELASENQGATLNTISGAQQERVPDMASTIEHPATACPSKRNLVNQDDQSSFPRNRQNEDEMAFSKKQGNTITTNDLLASEAPGSWALSTPGSVHCDNMSLRTDEKIPGIGRTSDEGFHQDFVASQVGTSEDVNQQLDCLRDQETQPETTPAAGSQNYPVTRLDTCPRREHQALNVLIDIIAPDFRQMHGLGINNGHAPDTEEDTEEEEDHNSQDDDTQEELADQNSE